MNNFTKVGYLYYTGERANRVFDKQAGEIFDFIIKESYSSGTSIDALLPTALIKTTDQIMKPPILLYSILGSHILLGILCTFLFRRERKQKKCSQL